jgi:hypothetical protein
MFAKYEIQIGHAKDRDLMIGDVLVTPQAGLAPHQGVAVHEANDLFMPISPDVLIALCPETGEIDLPAAQVDYYDGLQAPSTWQADSLFASDRPDVVLQADVAHTAKIVHQSPRSLLQHRIWRGQG